MGFVIIVKIVIIIILIIIIYFCIETLFSWSRAEGVARDGRCNHLKGNLRSIYEDDDNKEEDDDDDNLDNLFIAFDQERNDVEELNDGTRPAVYKQ